MAENESQQLDWGLLAGSVGPRVRVLRNALTARSIAVSAPHGLPTGSLTVLSLVAANPGSSQTALADRAGLNKSALVGIMDQLEQHGLITRDRSAIDRRRYGVTVTPEGERAM
jgi:DNA-binding MarR family transcriptional regulator